MSRTTPEARSRPRRLAICLVLVAVLTAPSGVVSQPAVDPDGKSPEPSRGAVLFRLHCASCHGAEARGDGPIARHLETRPPDLTRIAARRDGRFPPQEIERLIDGRLPLESHGPSEMPVWGLSFRQPDRLEDQEEEIWLQIRQLVRYLRTLQVGEVVDEGRGSSRGSRADL